MVVKGVVVVVVVVVVVWWSRKTEWVATANWLCRPDASHTSRS